MSCSGDTALENGSQTRVGVQFVTRACSALTKSVRLGSSEPAYSPCFIYDGWTPLLHVVMSRSDNFSPVSQRTSLDGMRHSVKTEAKVGKAAWERSVAANHVIGLLNLYVISDLHALLGTESLYTLDDHELSEWSAVALLQFIAPALCSVCILLLSEVVHPLQMKKSAEERPKMIDLDDEGNAVSRSATATEVELCAEEHRSLMYRAEARQPSSVDSFSAEKGRPS